MSETLLYVILLKLSIQKSDVHLDFPTDREKKDGEFLEGNNRFEGYSLELIDGISKILGFQYRMELVPDGKYGSYNKVTKKWDGLVKHLLDRVSARHWSPQFKFIFIQNCPLNSF